MSQNILPNNTDRESLLAALAAGQTPPEIAPFIQVGRKAELLALKANISRVEAGGSCWCLVTGPPGAGKTQLLNIAGELALTHGLVASVSSIFAYLRLVIIDELHALLDEERGIHVQSLLSRIFSLVNNRPRLVGLSATIGSTTTAQEFL